MAGFSMGGCRYMMNMYTLPKYRRKGLGTRLLELFKEEGKRLDIGMMHLHASREGANIYRKVVFTDANLPKLTYAP